MLSKQLCPAKQAVADKKLLKFSHIKPSSTNYLLGFFYIYTMKKQLLLIALAILTLQTFGQPKSITQDFETGLLTVKNDFTEFKVTIGNTPNNIWQIGSPKKVYFDSAYRGNKAIVTDTINNVPKNNYSYFDVVIPEMAALFANLMCEFSFNHKYQTTNKKSGGYILVSTDSRASWKEAIDTNNQLSFCDVCDVKLVDGIYKHSDTLDNGNPAFSGTSNNWESVYFRFGSMAVKKQPYDTLIFRFVFQSDSTTDNKEGWMIDDIRLSKDFSSGFRERNNTNVSLFPNPSKDKITLQSFEARINKISIKDIIGKSVMEESINGETSIQLAINHLPAGQYFIKVETDKGLSTQRLILQ